MQENLNEIRAKLVDIADAALEVALVCNNLRKDLEDLAADEKTEAEPTEETPEKPECKKLFL